MIGADELFGNEQQLIANLSLRYAVPAIHQSRGFVRAGGLMMRGARWGSTLVAFSRAKNRLTCPFSRPQSLNSL